MKILSEGHIVETNTYQLFFKTFENGGYAFDCDELGNVNIEALSPTAIENYQAMLKSGIKPTIEHYHNRYYEPAVGECKYCRAEVVLDPKMSVHGIDCKCGAIYNSFGQELRPRDQWEENYWDF